MPPLPTIANIYRVTWDWSMGFSLQAHNIIHFADTGLSGSEADLFAALGDNLTGAMFQTMANQSSLVGIDILPLDGSSSTTDHPLDGTLTGLGSSEGIAQASTIVSLYTGLRGPRHRGRVFLPFVAEGSQNGGVLGTSDLAAQQAAWNAFLADMDSSNWPIAQASYVHADAHPVTAVTVKRVVGTQRRRLDQLR